MPPDEPPHLPDGRPYPGYEGPRGFSDVDGGYPIEEDLIEEDATGAAQGGKQVQPAQDPEADSLVPPASPVAGRRLHNPLPAAAPSDDDAFWYGPEPERVTWKVIAPIAVLLVCAGLGVWLAIPSATEQGAQPPPASPTPGRTLSQRPVPDPATRWPTPTWRTPTSSTPTVRRTPRTSATPAPTPSRVSSPPPARQSTTIRPSATRPPQPQPTVTVTRKVKVTVTPTPKRTRPQDGPEEPPGPPTRPPASPRPSPTCVTWGDCHDTPPKG
ncbi:hypothetical protein [Nonomuraea turcica]|uniref:hypothetical protein n=1 Tax=Nonomuraea sp. G32 TaxID=3067274 RepID=UPI00273BC590|nr:hypothetical protein [Nonomuraea sp. G32]MDP4511836.1 hypothetical protein [Nonomuraea sp. G32]